MIRLPRGRRAAALGASLTLLVTAACAQTGGDAATDDYPAKPIELLVGYAAGGSTDIGARFVAEALEKKLDATVTVVNKPGANSQIAYTQLTQSTPDGYTLSAVTFPSAIVTVLDKSRGATYTRDSFAPVALQVVDPTAVAVAPDNAIRTPQDLVNAAKAAPGELQATTTGVASNEHFALARLKQETGADIAPVHFADGSTATSTAFLGGNVPLLLGNVSDLQPVVEAGDARIIGVMAAERSPFFPDAPTFTESGYDVEISSSRGFVFPADTPDAIVDRVSTAIGEIMADKAFQKKMTDAGLAPSYKDHDDYVKYWAETSDLFADLMPLVREGQS
ncbi:tripartite tricarboxylate transporter substrate binding protein [Actinophytocola sediminis]